ncbi:MAG: DNA-deoxyinosine glycosylase [Bacillota bacterium]|nr:DNA-deoxyinosine glycosylase [Bacillota bacterium]
MIHSFKPIVDEDCKILILGTMPGVQSLKKQEYYGNKQNAFWRIIFSLFNEEMTENYDEKISFILEHNIALWDVLKACEREGSLDSDIKNPEPNDFHELFSNYKRIKDVFFNGGPAEKLFKKYVSKSLDAQGLIFHKLPSTSPAYTVGFDKKFDEWKSILNILRHG